MRKIFFFLLMAFSCSVWAEWVLVTKSEARGVFFYIDPASIRREGNLRKFWQLADFKERNKSLDKSYRSKIELDCKEEIFRVSSITIFSESMLKGNITNSFNYPNSEWENIAPGTLDADTMEYVCAK